MKQNLSKIVISLVFLIGLSSFIFYGHFAKEAMGSVCAQSETQDTKLLDHMPQPWTEETSYSYPIVHTAQTAVYSDQSILADVHEGDDYYGQDGHYLRNLPSYQDNGDGTITDLVTGLMWQKTMDEKMTPAEAEQYANQSNLADMMIGAFPPSKNCFL